MRRYARSYGRRLLLATATLLAALMVSSLGCSSDSNLVVLTESEMVYFVKPGETFENKTEQELVILSKGSYVVLAEAAGNSIGGERHDSD